MKKQLTLDIITIMLITVALSGCNDIKTNSISQNDHSNDYLNENLAPLIVFHASSYEGTAPLSVNFTVDTYDEDGYIESYYWTFGDGYSSFEKNPIHTFEKRGRYTVICTVIDNGGAKNSYFKSIYVRVPKPEILDSCIVESGSDDFYIKGILKNIGDIPIYDIDIEISFYDSENNLIMTNREFIYNEMFGMNLEIFATVIPITVYPGEKAYFYDNISNISYYDYYEIDIINYRELKNASKKINSEDLEISEIECENSYYDDWKVCYTINNVGTDIYRNVRLIIIFYNSVGELMNIESDTIKTLYAGQKETLSISFSSSDKFNPNNITDYEVILSYN
jgi:PKD repeat protein